MKEKCELVYSLWNNESYYNLGKGPISIVSRVNDVCNKKQAIVALREVKQWKYATIEDYYDILL
jgi:hypothetical protein